jgi:hypothetical protein
MQGAKLGQWIVRELEADGSSPKPPARTQFLNSYDDSELRGAYLVPESIFRSGEGIVSEHVPCYWAIQISGDNAPFGVVFLGSDSSLVRIADHGDYLTQDCHPGTRTGNGKFDIVAAERWVDYEALPTNDTLR